MHEIVNSKTGERVSFKPGGSDLCAFEFRVSPRGGVFVPHLHLYQTETLHIRQGELTIAVGGEARRVLAGQTLVLPPRTGHTIQNTGSGEAIADVEFTPAGRTELFLLNIFGLAEAGRTDTKGDLPLLHAAIFMPHYDVFRSDIPLIAQRLLFAILKPIAWLVGYRARYPEYDGTTVSNSQTRA
jgi:mannose-6-phosphate isomerase-like protein (cupin superfamily)